MRAASDALAGQLWKDFEAAPFDDLNGPALADYLEESGEAALARAVRWMAEKGHAPDTYHSGLRDYCVWWNADRPKNYQPIDPSDIPGEVFAALPGGSLAGRFVECGTFSAAVASLAAALDKLEADR